MRKTIATTLALSAAALTLGVPGAAHADRYAVDDPEDTHHGSDVLTMTVQHGKKNVAVTTRHLGLRKDPATGSGGTVYFDTDPSDQGPEFVFVGGYFEGTDYTLNETEGFGRKQWGDPVQHGDYILRIRYQKDQVRLVVSRPALGHPAKVRVAVRASGTRTDGTGTGLVDWVGKPRQFTPWLAR